MDGLLDFSGLLEMITRKDEKQFNNVMYVCLFENHGMQIQLP